MLLPSAMDRGMRYMLAMQCSKPMLTKAELGRKMPTNLPAGGQGGAQAVLSEQIEKRQAGQREECRSLQAEEQACGQCPVASQDDSRGGISRSTHRAGHTASTASKAETAHPHSHR